MGFGTSVFELGRFTKNDCFGSVITALDFYRLTVLIIFNFLTITSNS